MAILQFYRNQYRYPHYSNSLTSYGESMPCTPVGVNLKSGTLRVKGTMTDFMSCNYLRLTRDGQHIYAWIDNVTFKNEDVFEVSYSVDAWRTYKSKINLGTQYIARRPQATSRKDKLLGGLNDYPDITSVRFPIGLPNKRIFVVQVRPASGELNSRTPVQPNPYQFFLREYDVNDSRSDASLSALMSAVSGAEPVNIVTMYSIPYMNISGLQNQDLIVKTASSNLDPITGFKFLNGQDPATLLHIETPFSLVGIDIDELLRVEHSVQLVIPEAGILDVPDELLVKGDLQLRQDVDLFSGASNYMLVDGDGSNAYTQSVRGSSISSIPIVSDPLDTYLSQNQNALSTALMGDVASIAGGAAMMMGGGGLIAGAGGLASAFGGGTIISGINNIVGREAQQADMARAYTNPPAFLGTALASNYNQQFWVVVRKTGVTNSAQVHSNFGYPYGIIDALSFPSAGYIQTEGCAVMSTDGSVPRWALDEINSNFNNGILVH